MLYGDTIGALKDLLKSLLQRNLTPHGLQDMFAVGAAWRWGVLRGEAGERRRLLARQRSGGRDSFGPGVGISETGPHFSGCREVRCDPGPPPAEAGHVARPPWCGAHAARLGQGLEGRKHAVAPLARDCPFGQPCWCSRRVAITRLTWRALVAVGGTHTQPHQEAETPYSPEDGAGMSWWDQGHGGHGPRVPRGWLG